MNQLVEVNFEKDGFPDAKIVGQPELKVDPATGKFCCYFDGQSHFEFNPVHIGKKDFGIETIFRPTKTQTECGIFGSTGYRIALRQNRHEDSASFWINFPYSVKPIALKFTEIYTDKENYFAMTRVGDRFRVRLNNTVSEMVYDHDYWSYSLWLGAYYSHLYSFNGYIREFRLVQGELDINHRNPI